MERIPPFFRTVYPNRNHVTTHPDHTMVVFYVRRMVDLMKTAKVNAYIMYIFGKIEINLYMPLKMHFLMTSKRHRHTYISDTGNMVEIRGTFFMFVEWWIK